MAGKLFLGGISPNTTTEAIEAHFSKYGNVIDAVVMYKDGKHRGFGFVTFDNPDSVQAVLNEEQVIDGRTVDVKQAVPQGEVRWKSQVDPTRLVMRFEELGWKHAMPREPDFATYTREQAPPPRGANGDMFMGSHVLSGGRAPVAYASLPTISTAPPPSSSPSCDKVFIGGLAQTTTDDMVREYFSQYGTIIDCVVMKDRGSQRSRGFGFVQYDSPGPVDQIMSDYANHQIEGKWIEVKKAIPQDQMPATSTAGLTIGKGGFPCAGKGYGQSLWTGRSAYVSPAQAYPAYGAAASQFIMGAYSPYGVQTAYGQPAVGSSAYTGAYVGAMGRPTFRQRPY